MILMFMYRAFTTVVCFALIAVLLLCGRPARGQIIDEKDTGTKLKVTKDDGTKLSIDKDDEPKRKKRVTRRPPATARKRTPSKPNEFILNLRGRWVFIPDALLNKFYTHHPSYSTFSTAIEFIWRKAGRSYDLVFSLDYTSAMFPSANWVKNGSLVGTVDLGDNAADYTQINLHFLSLDVTFVYPINIGRYVQFLLGAGFGIGVLLGNITSTDLLPTCAPPLSECQHWRQVTKSTVSLPSRVWPVVNLLVGFNVRYKGFQFKVESGFRNALFLGGAVGYQF